MDTQETVSLPLWQVATVFLAMFFVFLLAGGVALVVFGDAVGGIIAELSILIVPLVYLLSKGIDVKKYVKISFNPKFILIGLGCGLLMLILNIIVTAGLISVLGESTAIQQANQQFKSLAASSPLGLAAVAASLILAGICEEFAFRGFLQNSIFKSLKKSTSTALAFAVAVAVAALVFGFFHFDVQAVYTLGAFVLALFLGYFYHRWNYTVSATAHATMNMLFLALLLWS